MHESLVHTLGNLTLTRLQLRAEQQLVRCQAHASLPERTGDEPGNRQPSAGAAPRSWSVPPTWPNGRSTWPGPIRPQPKAVSAARWDLLDRTLAELPAGAWTSYGDIAALIGSDPVPVGDRLANHPVPNAHRVLRTPRHAFLPDFPLARPADKRDPISMLRAEGVTFDGHGRANPSQRMSTTELAQLHGVELEEYVPGSGADGTREEKFLAQLDELQPPSVIDSVRRLLSAWIELDGYLDFGKGDETSCFLMLAGSQTRPDIWPLTLYPSGRSEVVFQHLARRAPFDDPALREQLRQRLNTVEGVDLPAAKIELRPSFPRRC